MADGLADSGDHRDSPLVALVRYLGHQRGGDGLDPDPLVLPPERCCGVLLGGGRNGFFPGLDLFGDLRPGVHNAASKLLGVFRDRA